MKTEWKELSDEETEAFRAKAAERARSTKKLPAYSPTKKESRGFFEVVGAGLLKDSQGQSVELASGELVRVLSKAEMEKHEGQPWVYTVREVRVSYAGKVESLLPGKQIAVMPKEVEIK